MGQNHITGVQEDIYIFNWDRGSGPKGGFIHLQYPQAGTEGWKHINSLVQFVDSWFLSALTSSTVIDNFLLDFGIRILFVHIAAYFARI